MLQRRIVSPWLLKLKKKILTTVVFIEVILRLQRRLFYTGLVTRDFQCKFRYMQPKLQFPMVSSFLNQNQGLLALIVCHVSFHIYITFVHNLNKEKVS
jgi:hypothetical protein